MKQGETLFLEIKVYDDGLIRARRKDRKPLTVADREEARQLADSLPGITVDDVLRIFPWREGEAMSRPIVKKKPSKPKRKLSEATRIIRIAVAAGKESVS